MSADDSTTHAFNLLVTRYLGGEASSSEREQLVAQLTDPAWKAQFERIRYVWEKAGEAPKIAAFDTDEALGRLRSKLAAQEAASVPSKAPAAGRHDKWSIALLAASIAVLLTALGVRYFAASDSQPVAAASQLITRQNGVGERSQVVLPDGSRITLNSVSTLSYLEKFDAKSRVVRLKGEAYFEVAHETARPFVVETDNLRVSVLGTKFNVISFDDGAAVSVALLEGRVRVFGRGPKGASSPVELAPGQKFTYTPSTSVAAVQSTTPEAAVAWIEDHLVVDGEPLSGVMRRLQRRFGVAIELKDPALAQQPITGRFDGESLDQILELLHLAGIVDYELVRTNGKIERVMISPGRFSPKATARN